jgi:hypothetical protein
MGEATAPALAQLSESAKEGFGSTFKLLDNKQIGDKLKLKDGYIEKTGKDKARFTDAKGNFRDISYNKLSKEDYSFLNSFFTPSMVNEINKAVAEAAKMSSLVPARSTSESSFYGAEKGIVQVVEKEEKKKEEMKEQTKLAAIREESISKAIEEVLKAIELEKLILGDKDFLSAKDEKANAKIREDEEKRINEMMNSRFSALVVPRIIYSTIKSMEDRALINKNLVVNEGQIAKMPKSLARIAGMRELESQIGSAWKETKSILESRKETYIQQKTKEQRVSEIQTHIPFEWNRKQRNYVNEAMNKGKGANEKKIDVANLKEVSLKSMSDAQIKELHNFVLKIGTEKENEFISETKKIKSLDSNIDKEDLAKAIEKKADDLHIKLNEDDKKLINEIRKTGLYENRKEMLIQFPKIVYEIYLDNQKVSKVG